MNGSSERDEDFTAETQRRGEPSSGRGVPARSNFSLNASNGDSLFPPLPLGEGRGEGERLSDDPSPAEREKAEHDPTGPETSTKAEAGAAETPPFPTSGRLLGLDYGTKRVGIAVSNTEQTIASPLDVYQVQTPQQNARYLQKIAAEYEVVGLVVGLPVHMSGQESQKSREARAFGKWASETTQFPVTFHDERYTSSIAESYLLSAELSKKKRQARIDKLAAQILLQSYLDAAHRDAPPADWRSK